MKNGILFHYKMYSVHVAAPQGTHLADGQVTGASKRWQLERHFLRQEKFACLVFFSGRGKSGQEQEYSHILIIWWLNFSFSLGNFIIDRAEFV